MKGIVTLGVSRFESQTTGPQTNVSTLRISQGSRKMEWWMDQGFSDSAGQKVWRKSYVSDGWFTLNHLFSRLILIGNGFPPGSKRLVNDSLKVWMIKIPYFKKLSWVKFPISFMVLGLPGSPRWLMFFSLTQRRRHQTFLISGCYDSCGSLENCGFFSGNEQIAVGTSRKNRLEEPKHNNGADCCS